MVDPVNVIRCLAADVVQGAKSGHPGAPMGLAPIAHYLFRYAMRYDPKDPKWIARDRFVLSNGHASALMYTMLHLAGFGLTLQDLKNFRQIGSKTPGHPERGETDGVEVTTGPLGQGISNAVGMAAAQKHLSARYKKEGLPDLFSDTFVYCISGDGCLQEGISSETCSLAGTLELGNLVVFWDDNKIQIDGSTDIAFREDVCKRFEAYGWQILSIPKADTAEMEVFEEIIKKAKADNRPTLIRCETVIGFGSAKEGSHHCHGSPLGEDDICAVKAKFGLPPKAKYHVPPEVYADYKTHAEQLALKHVEWRAQWEEYLAGCDKPIAEELVRRFSTGPQTLDGANLKAFVEKMAIRLFADKDKPMATRKLGGIVLNEFAKEFVEIMGGSADLTGSNCTNLSVDSPFTTEHPEGREMHFGVREHGMVAMTNGISAFGGFVPFDATFLVFIGYAIGSVRVAALSHLRSLHVMTHDSIFLGEDGPTHQPVETLAQLRAMPNVYTFRPCDGVECVGAYGKCFIDKESKDAPYVVALSRQNLPSLPGSDAYLTLSRGAYVTREAEKPDMKLILVATGSEVELAINSAVEYEKVFGKGVRVVSAPCVDIFREQDEEYKREVFPDGCGVLSIEASLAFGWEGVLSHEHHGMGGFGASAPASKLAEKFGFTVESVIAHMQRLAKRSVFHPLIL
ncbi:Transketolase [Aduncisulcus paluster]|uniref:Transketolase n=1 Tax=Aduncisulcus paluster TaxID=2918883 RepID=A0ABQ5KBB1_9EUKA|nr:Transketolase [Aduncisulcus paluster]|eukprot:gnl/Carplike_NY0171/869_a1194_1225.p1 GENE.gnl/Carplike_NY0171/869_a1194_1225~~gnl/Carplike_NY0171/869_a1194_1225.p1  ORF type:complete len:683 (+),score=237.08 gnl/Carplike_NY0171/869_a1194_1225:39-2087(+)